MKRVLITGGAGFIGSALSSKLSDLGHTVTVLDNLSPQIHGEGAEFSPELRRAARCLRGDVTDPAVWPEALEGQEAVVHLAAETGTGQSMYEISRYCAVNVAGTALLLEACLAGGSTVSRIVLASSRAVYGEGRYGCPDCGVFFPGSRSGEEMEKGDFELRCPTCGKPGSPQATDEESPIKPVSIYGVTKAAQEQLLSAFAPSWDGTAVALRFQNIYGPGQSLRNPYTGILSIFSSLLLAGDKIDIYEDGTESRDFLFVTDAVRGLVAALESDPPPRVTYNCGTGVCTPVTRVVSLLGEAYGVTPRAEVSGRFRCGDIRHNFADTARAARDLGFTWSVPLEEGIRAFSAWVRQQETPPSLYGISAEELSRRNLLKGGK